MPNEIFVGSVAVGVVPDASGWNRTLQRELVPSAESVGREYGRELSRGITTEMGRAGEKSGGAFSETFRKRTKAALDAIPKDATGPLAELRRKLEEISQQDIVDPKKAARDIDRISADLDKLSKKAKGIDITFNTRTARAQLDLLARDIRAKTDRGPGLISRITGGIGNITPGLAGTAGAGGQGGAGLAALAPAGLVNPYTVAAALAAIPFLAQAAAGAITFGLGGALAGIGLLGAGMDKSFQDSTKKVKGHTVTMAGDFTKFKDSAMNDLREIGKPMIPLLRNILDTVSHVLKVMTPLFKSVMGVLAGPLKVFVDTILKSFTRPEVQKSIQAVATAFVKILEAFTPDIPGLFDSFAQAIERIASAVAKNPKAFADFINFLFQVVIFAINAIAWLTNMATWIEQHFKPAVHEIAVIFDGVRHEVAHIWDIIFNNTIGAVIRIHQGIQHWLDRVFHDIAHTFDMIRHEVAHIWDMIWNNTVGRVIRGYHDVLAIYNRLRQDIINWFHNVLNTSRQIWDTIWNNTIGRAIRGWHDLMRVFSQLKSDVINWFHTAVNWLVNSGKDIISGLLNGIRNGMAAIGNWIRTNVYDPIISHIKSFFGISSPSTVMAEIGKNLISGLIGGMFKSAKNLTHFIKNIFGGLPAALGSLVSKGLVAIKNLPAKALNALGSIAGKIGGFFAKLFGGHVGSGVQQWAGLVAQALSMLGLPLSLAPRVLYQMQTESGGNPNAINNWDINAAQGDPSRGLMQVIGSTFAAYHVPGTSSNIYDPLANIAAAINYARHVYGPSLMRGSMGMGSGHGYDAGGWLMPGATLAWNMTGRPEPVLSPSQWDKISARVLGSDGGPEYHAHFDGLTGAAIESHVQTAFRVMSVTQGALSRQGRRI